MQTTEICLVSISPFQGRCNFQNFQNFPFEYVLHPAAPHVNNHPCVLGSAAEVCGRTFPLRLSRPASFPSFLITPYPNINTKTSLSPFSTRCFSARPCSTRLLRCQSPVKHSMSSADSDKASSAGASSSHNSSNSSAARSGPPAPIDPILRNALRYTLSAKEYELLHQYLLSRAPAVKKRTLHPKRYDAITKGPDDYNVAAVRDSLRLGVGTFVGLKIWDLITSKMKKERCVFVSLM